MSFQFEELDIEVYFIPSKYECNYSSDSEVMVFLIQGHKVLMAEHCAEFKWLFSLSSRTQMRLFQLEELYIEVYFIPSKYETNKSSESEVIVFLIQGRKILTAEHCSEFKWLFLSAPILK